MNYYKEIKIQSIDLNKKPFSFSLPEFDQKLFESISNIGLTNPPILLLEKSENKHLVVSGLRRILACKKLGMKALQCRIIKRSRPDYEELVLLNLRIKLTHRKLNDIEIANLFALLKKTGVSREKIIKTYMPELKLEKSRKIYEDISSLNSLKIKTKKKFIEWQLPLKISVALVKFSKTDRDSVMKMIETLLPGTNRLNEIIMLLEEIALSQNHTITDIINLHLINILNDSGIRIKERTEKIRVKLKELRYPQITKLERKWDKYIKDLHLPPEVKITQPLSYEGKKIKVEILFSTKDSISNSISKLNNALKSGSLEGLIQLSKP